MQRDVGSKPTLRFENLMCITALALNKYFRDTGINYYLVWIFITNEQTGGQKAMHRLKTLTLASCACSLMRFCSSSCSWRVNWVISSLIFWAFTRLTWKRRIRRFKCNDYRQQSWEIICLSVYMYLFEQFDLWPLTLIFGMRVEPDPG